MMRLYLSVLFLFTWWATCSAVSFDTHPYYISINRSNGLPSEEVYDIFEDKKGFFWLATGRGLYRYDGYSYMLWQSEAQSSAAGSCIAQDRFGRIWYENFDGYLYYTDKGVLHPLAQNRPQSFMPFGITDKYLFVAQANGVDVFDLSTLAIVKTISIRMKRLEHATTGNGGYYLAADDNVYHIDASLSVSSHHLPLSARQEQHYLFFERDSLFVLPRLSNEHAMLVYDGKLANAATMPMPAMGYSRGIISIASNTWIYSSTGCVAIRAGETGKGRLLFPGKSISRILQDRNGNLWFATTNEGIYIVPDLNNTIYTFGQAKIRQVAVAHSGVLVGTHTGELCEVMDGSSNIRVVDRDKHNADIYYLYADTGRVIYSATGSVLFSGKRRQDKRTTEYAIKSVVPAGDKYYAVAASGACMLVPNQGAYTRVQSVWDKATRFAPVNMFGGGLLLLSGIRARSVAYDSASQAIFCATNSGIMAITPDTAVMVTNNGRPVFASQLAAFNGYIYAVDARGRLQRFTAAGMKADVVAGIPGSGSIRLLKVSGRRLYYCAKDHLYQYMSPTGVRAVNMYVQADEINDFAATDSCLWLATDGGLVSVDDHHDPVARHVPGFYINSVIVNGSEADSSQLMALPPGNNNITINYSIVEFAAPVAASLLYTINGGGWNELPRNSRLLQFRSLAPGGYIIRFRVNGHDTKEQVQFSIPAPFWQQVWFYLVCVLFLFFMAQLYYGYRMKMKMKKVEEQKHKLQLEQRLSRSMLSALRSQMNPHFFFNALNTIQAYIFTNERSKAGDYLAKLSMLTRTILEMSEAETVILTNELEALELYLDLEQARFGADFRYQIQAFAIPDTSAIEIPSMIIQPFVENAVKHGLLHKEGAKILDITFSLVGKELQIIIDDNGIGRARSEALNELKNRKYRSYSTRATAERVKLLNAGTPDRIFVSITDKATAEGIACGTMVAIKIKL